MQSLLIAEGAEEMSAGIVKHLQGEFRITVCNDGETALDLLQTLRPDILILNLMLPFKDGLTLLQESAYRPPVILALSHFVSPYYADRALELGVGALLLTPTPHTVAVRLVDMISGTGERKEPASLVSQTALLLHLLHFSSSLDGYRQLCIGIPLYRQDPQQNLSKELYPAIAEAYGCKSVKSVEHSIRKAIADAWKRRNAAVWDKYFPLEKKPPSNKVFIACVAEMLEEKQSPDL